MMPNFFGHDPKAAQPFPYVRARNADGLHGTAQGIRPIAEVPVTPQPFSRHTTAAASFITLNKD